MWQVEFTDELAAWWDTLSEDEQDAFERSVVLLQADGPNLGRPHVDTLQSSRFDNLKDLRTQHRGRPFRTFFAFDPRRTAILLICGDKTGEKRFYERMIPIAEQLYITYLQEIETED